MDPDRRRSTHGGQTAALYAGLLSVVVCVAGCNCSDLGVLSSVCTASGATTDSAAGIWSGTDSATGLELTGFVDSEGQATFFRSDGVQFVGTPQVSGTTITISLNGYTQYGAGFADGSTSGIGTFNGTLSAASSISGTLDFTTSAGTSVTSTWSLAFDSLYGTASSLSTISGNYTDSLAAVSDGLDPMSGSSVTISSAGVMYAQGSTDGCVLNGTVTDEDTSNDLYQVSYAYENCTGNYAALNGVQFTGLAEFNPTESPTEIVMAVTGEGSDGTDYGVISELSGS